MSDVEDLADWLNSGARKLDEGKFEAVEQAAKELQRRWRANARRTAGAHGKHYPSSITSEQIPSADAVWEVGPQYGRKQGSMGPGFEFGSVNQPPHWDGTTAFYELESVFQRDLETLADKAFD